MAYPNGTILKRIDQFEPEYVEEIGSDGEKHDVVANEADIAVNLIRVVTLSPVRNSDTREEWQVEDKDYYIVQPVEYFGQTLVAPEKVLRKDYEVDSYPEDDELPQTREELQERKRKLLESPEDAFARAAREDRKAAVKRPVGRPRKEPTEA